MEFLGDAVLDYAVTRFLFTTDATARLSPGALTDLRSALVNNVVFGALAVRHGLHAFLRAAAPPLTRTMALFLRHHHDVVRGDLDVLIAPVISFYLYHRTHFSPLFFVTYGDSLQILLALMECPPLYLLQYSLNYLLLLFLSFTKMLVDLRSLPRFLLPTFPPISLICSLLSLLFLIF